MRDLLELNINENGKLVTRPKPTINQIANIENLIGCELPKDYVDFLLFSNGGHPEIDTFSVDINNISQMWSIDRFFCISYDKNFILDIFWQYNHYMNIIPKYLLPIARDGGGNLICLYLCQDQKSEVFLWIHDADEIKLHFVSKSFNGFIDSLYMNPDYI